MCSITPIIKVMRYKKEEISALNKIYNAMIALLNEKSYTSINNSQIIKKAEISRSTYYIYFKNKDQIISTICDDTFNHIFNTHLTKEKHHDFSKDHPDELKHIIVHSYYHFLEDRDLVLSILNSGASSIFLNQLRKRIKPLVVSLIDKKIIGNNSVPLDIKTHQYVNGYTALLQYYLRHAEDLKPETISEYYFTMCK